MRQVTMTDVQATSSSIYPEAAATACSCQGATEIAGLDNDRRLTDCGVFWFVIDVICKQANKIKNNRLIRIISDKKKHSNQAKIK